MRSAGMALSPFNAWVVLKGLETLSIRMQAQSAARRSRLRRGSSSSRRSSACTTPGSKSHPQHALAMAQQSGSGGAVVSFIVRGKGAEQAARSNAFHVIDSTRICSITANLGDTKTTITHPASTSHGRLTEEQRLAAGITQGMIRVAVGLDDIDDIKADLLRGLESLDPAMTPEVRTRIAPSPTGFLHLGTARTALYSWAYARATTAASSSCASKTPTSRARRRTSVDADPRERCTGSASTTTKARIYQMQRLERYQRGARADARATARAYRCYCTPGRARRDARGAARAQARRRATTAAGAPSPARRCRRCPQACSR